jgi:hypothetical protein
MCPQAKGKNIESSYSFFRNLAGLAEMVAKKLDSIPQHTRIKLWHHSTLWLLKYLAFERL